MEEENNQPVSVSVSPYFKELLKKFNFSPTEVFRVGMAVMLCENGDLKYRTAFNLERLEKAKKTLEELKRKEEIKKEIIEIEKAVIIYKNLKQIKGIIRAVK